MLQKPLLKYISPVTFSLNIRSEKLLLKYTFLIVFLSNIVSGIPIVSAQDKHPVSGLVLSGSAQEPVVGVTITLKNKSLSSVTNTEGKFILLLPGTYSSADSLIFSSVGYQPVSIAVNEALNDKELVIKLNHSVQNLKEVTISRLSLKQVLDSVRQKNFKSFVSPVQLKGYYRELVFTNSKCTEYADALCEYFYDAQNQPEGQLKINASRCRKEVKKNEDKNNFEVYKESKITPNTAFQYALFSEMINVYFPEKSLAGYKYKEEQSEISGVVKITISPIDNSGQSLYQLVLNLNNDFVLKSYHLEIPDALLEKTKEKSLLGLHAKAGKLTIDVNYTSLSDGIYPSYYSISKERKIWGKMLGVTMDQHVQDKSEFVVTSLVQATSIKSFDKKEVYKKGNICTNGIAMNDEMLKEYTIILPAKNEVLSISN